MRASEINNFRRHLDQRDLENKENRRVLHENYEWLEGYWQSNHRIHGFDQFCQLYGNYLWTNVPETQESAIELSHHGPIGNNRNTDYFPTEEIVRATNTLRNATATSEQRFRAMMLLVRQIRNNLFHGKKMELTDRENYERNKTLIRIAARITTLILDNLEEAGEHLGL